MTEPNFVSGTIWTGDNLHIMRGMNGECVDLIYLDPPFNSNRNYEAPIGSKAAGAAFKDAWTLDDVDVCEHGELADRNPAAYSVIEAARQAHGKSMQSYLIFMAVRLLEMHRILKPTGSIYLHCDPTASHYLKLLMDGIFGPRNCRNEIVWRRTPAKALMTKRLATNHDLLLVYQLTDQATWNGNAMFIPYDPANLDPKIASKYRHKDADGRLYQLDNLTNPNPNRPNLTYEFLGVTKVWRWTRERMQATYDAGLIVQSRPGSVPRLKRYLDEQRGRPLGDVWGDISPINSQAQERLGYPTQKPLALLERIIEASSNPGDLVLDPFCGCATTLVAADRLQRKWAGIDLSPLAIKLVNERIAEDRAATKQAKYNPVIGGSLFGVTALTEPPSRTDLGDLPNYRTHRHRLYGVQEGVCVGCDTHFPFRVMDVDHILPRSRGGTDHPDNLQLLCSGCNRSKGNKTMAEWRAGASA